MSVLEITSYGLRTLRRLRLEARLIDPTMTPGLAPAYELDRCAATPSLVSGDLPDITLDDVVSISPLPAAAAIHALNDVADTLEAMHDSGLVHGDLRPATVFVLPDGRAALARPDRSEPAPGTDREPGRRDDALDFAILAFEVLTGVHPLAPENVVAMTSSLPMLPPPAAHVLELALTIAPDRRPFPHALMVALDAIPAEDWPTNGLHRPPPEPTRLAPPMEPAVVEPVAVEPVAVEAAVMTAHAPGEPEPTEPGPIEPGPIEPGPIETPIIPAPAKRSVFRRILGPFVILLGLATVFTGGAAGASLLFAPNQSAGDPEARPPHVRRVSLSVTPPQALCPYAAMLVTATIVTEGGPGELELRWRLPDGSTADTESFAVDGGRRVLRASIDLTLSGHEQLLGEVVAVISGTRASVPIRYLCPSAVKKQKKDRARSV